MIWLISKYALPIEYGAQGRLFYIAEELKKLGHEVLVITSSFNHLAELPYQKKKFKLEKINEINTLFIKGLKFKNSLSKKRIISWFIFEVLLFYFIIFKTKGNSLKPSTVVISSLSLLTILNGIFAKWYFKSKLVFEIRDIWPLSAISVANYSKYNPFILLLRQVEIIGYKYSDVVISPLPNLSMHIRNSIKRNVEFKHISQGFCTNNIIKNEKIEKDLIDKYIPRNKFIFAYIGNIVDAYDLETLIKCAIKIRNIIPNIHFIVLGDGPYKNHLIKISQNSENITFMPRISKSKIQDFLSYCDVATNFLRPEPLFEFGVSPQKLIDYMLAAKPVLMSYSGYKTIVEEVGFGYIVEAGNVNLLVDKMIQMYNTSKDELIEMGKKGNNYLRKNLSWEFIVKNNLEIFINSL